MPRMLKVVGGVVCGALLAQLALGWALGLRGAWAAVLLVAAMAAALVMVDAGHGNDGSAESGAYDAGACAVVGLAVSAAAASLYLPTPWGGLGAGAILMLLLVSAIALSE